MMCRSEDFKRFCLGLKVFIFYIPTQIEILIHTLNTVNYKKILFLGCHFLHILCFSGSFHYDTISWLGVLLLAPITMLCWKCDFLNVYVGCSCHLRTMGKKVPKAAGFGYILSLRNYLNFLHMLQATFLKDNYLYRAKK